MVPPSTNQAPVDSQAIQVSPDAPELLDPPQAGDPAPTSPRRRGSIAGLTALGIVFGDLGTSPLYTLQTVVQATGGHFTSESALGILSLVTWTLIIVISIKYCVFVMRADNRGEGGILALMSLVGGNSFAPKVRFLTVMGLLGAALIYGDGIITPAISVLSALEGVNVVTAALKPYVMPAALVILVLLFASQRFGTEKIGRAFGPVMLLWFVAIAILGAAAIVHHPRVLWAIDPRHAVRFVAHAGAGGFLVLGGVFLCITGGEALYADMGHCGKSAIRWSWYLIVLPALLLSYAGQTSLLVDKGVIDGNPFFQIVPTWAVYPLVVLATAATVIASQAIITGSFSMTRQAMQLGWLPGVNIRQTSAEIYGQIYVPVVNWLMMIATVGITVGFGSSDRLAGAYGTAVSTTMLLTTGLLFVAMRKVWHWGALAAAAVGGVFLIVDGGYFVANLLKIVDGGWLPLSFAAVLFLIMITWRSGMDAIREGLVHVPQTEEQFLADLAAGRIPRVGGTTIFLTRAIQRIPRLIMDHVHFTGVLPRNVIALHVQFHDTPRAVGPTCGPIEKVADGVWHMVCHFGFVEIPDLRSALLHTRGLDPSIDLEQAVFIGARDLVAHKPGSTALRRWRLSLFGFLYRNAAKVVDRFNLPPRNVIEIARQVEI
jgi:KUP system potassium uptake protein